LLPALLPFAETASFGLQFDVQHTFGVVGEDKVWEAWVAADGCLPSAGGVLDGSGVVYSPAAHDR
jgi:hypothetical protein